MNLPGGAYCLIRSKHTDIRGWLVLVADYWEREQDHKSGAAPTMQSSHSFGPDCAMRRNLRPLIASVVHSEFASGHRGHRVDPEHLIKGSADPHGLLSHPHVVELEVTP